MNAAQAAALVYLLHQWAHVEPFADLDEQDIRCGGSLTRVTLQSNSLDPKYDDWSFEVFIDDDGRMWEWDDHGMFDPDDVTTWLEGEFLPHLPFMYFDKEEATWPS